MSNAIAVLAEVLRDTYIDESPDGAWVDRLRERVQILKREHDRLIDRVRELEDALAERGELLREAWSRYQARVSRMPWGSWTASDEVLDQRINAALAEKEGEVTCLV